MYLLVRGERTAKGIRAGGRQKRRKVKRAIARLTLSTWWIKSAALANLFWCIPSRPSLPSRSVMAILLPLLFHGCQDRQRGQGCRGLCPRALQASKRSELLEIPAKGPSSGGGWEVVKGRRDAFAEVWIVKYRCGVRVASVQGCSSLLLCCCKVNR